jgi:adenylosuccinate lyase
MIERYTLPEMKAVWTTEHRLEVWLRIERLVCESLAAEGKIPKEDLAAINREVRIDVPRMEAIEASVKHDVIAFLEMVSEQIGPSARYLHMGLTSSDILDTSLSVLMVEAADRIIGDLERLGSVLAARAGEFKETVMVGRSHGIHGEPVTFGLKLILWYKENERNLERMKQAREAVRVGKLSGAMGTFAHLSPSVEEAVCAKLGLNPAPVSNQVLQRDRHAQYLSALALTAASIEKFALEIRHLQRTEVREVEEYFSQGQKGSSAMPHKRNPVGSENLCGLSRVVRANAAAALENVPLWHERDISHSSVERIIIPDSIILVDYMLNRFTRIIETLIVYPENMKANLERSGGLIFSQRLLLELAARGIKREKAYEAVQGAAMAAQTRGGSFQERIKADPLVSGAMTAREIDNCFDLGYYLRNLNAIFKRCLG